MPQRLGRDVGARSSRRCRAPSQAELLRAFDLPIALMQDAEALERITAELVETKAADGVRYVEIRWGPLLHVLGGLSLVDGIGAVCAGARDASFRTGTVVRLICTALRSHDPAANVELARVAVQFRDQGLTGWDLAGPEEAFPDPLLHAAAFDDGPRGRPAGDHPRRRMGRCRPGPTRAGGRPGEDRARSGRHRRPGPVYRADDARHHPRPLPDLELAGGHRALDRGPSARPAPPVERAGDAHTDDTTVSDISLSEEYLSAVEKIGLTLPELWAIDRHALDVAFADEADLAPLREEFAAWGAAIRSCATVMRPSPR